MELSITKSVSVEGLLADSCPGHKNSMFLKLPLDSKVQPGLCQGNLANNKFLLTNKKMVKLKGQPLIILVMKAVTLSHCSCKTLLNKAFHQDWYIICSIPILNRQMHSSSKGNGQLQPQNLGT